MPISRLLYTSSARLEPGPQTIPGTPEAANLEAWVP